LKEVASLLPALLVGVMFGLSAGFAPGPLLTLVITQTLQHNTREGIKVAAAPLMTDVPIVLVSFFVLNELSTLGPALGIIAAVGGLYVLYLAYETLTTGPVKVNVSRVQPNSLRKGAVVNLLNPHPYLFWTTVGVPMILKTQQINPVAPWLFILGFYVFLVGSKVLIALVVGRFRAFLEGKIYLYMMRVLGAVLAGFAFYLLRDALVHFGLV
jgi:threonine/homoserine/homoserine lactone efflux protein